MDKRRPQDFPVNTLEKWKAEREQDHEAALSQIGNVTPEGLQNVLAQVLKDRDEKLHQALERLEQSDAEAAELLRGLVDEVASLRHSRYMDGGVTEQFAQAADRLYTMFRSGSDGRVHPRSTQASGVLDADWHSGAWRSSVSGRPGVTPHRLPVGDDTTPR